MAGILILCVSGGLILLLLIRALLYRPLPETGAEEDSAEFDREAAVRSLAALIRCRTVSRSDPALEENAEFEKLTDLLPELFPHVYGICELKRFGGRALLYHWRGRTPGDPAVLMAHYDVVPAEEEDWERPAFEGLIEDGFLWGRGTLDTKVTFNGILTAADSLIRQGFQPEHDIYLAFSGGEEVDGPGAENIVRYLQSQQITPSLVVDEGGAVVEDVFPGVKQKAALIGTAEKGMINLRYTVKSSGGHASAPGPHTPVGVLAEACARVEAHPFPAGFCPPVREMFDILGRYSGFGYRIIFANLWCFTPLLAFLGRKNGGAMNALMRTTVAFTQMHGSSVPNVIPTEAGMVSNIRICPGDTVQSVIGRITKIIGNPAVKLEVLTQAEPSRVSTTDCEGWKKVASAAASTWKGAIAAPYLMTQCSDSAKYGVISDKVYRFSAMDLSMDEISLIHGNNERIRLEVIPRTAEFFFRLMKQC